MHVLPGTRLGPYEVLSRVGAGGMGEVWSARDARLGRCVAIKILPREFLEDGGRTARFEREAKILAAFSHPNIVTVHDVGTHEGALYVVTELLEGETIREVLSHRIPTRPQILGWAVQMSHGLAAAHRKGIVHRDLKPENLFLTSDGHLKILDFGLARYEARVRRPHEADSSTLSRHTKEGAVLGTIGYMSPEQIQARAVDARSDLFSFGVLLYELLAGKHPFHRATPTATMGAILAEEPPPLGSLDPTVPRSLDAIVARCLEKERERRFQGAHDLGLALEAVLAAAPAGSAALENVEERSPYPGLSSFTEEDAGRFFGREEEVSALWEKLRTRRLLAVIGPSGAGKTSFVRAGVVASRPDGWGAIVSTPGRAPLRILGQALGPELSNDPEALRRLAGFEDPETAFDLLARWRRNHAESLVVVDQFEELFTLNDADARERFAALLGRLAGEGGLHVVLSMRDDFLMRCHSHAALKPVFGELMPLGPLAKEGLRRAIVEPAIRQGYRFEDDALVGEMVDAVGGERGALPLLAFAISRLWEKRDREQKVLTRAAYAEIGGVAGALAQHAEATMSRIGQAREGTVREIFRNLVTAQGTRAVLEREELLSALPDRSIAEEALRLLVDARLLTSWETEGSDGAAGHRIEIVHESLLKAWPRLVRWQTQDADGAQLRDQLRQAAHLWQERGKTEDLLWTGSSYLEYRAWRERYPSGLSSNEEEFAKAMANKARRRRRILQVAVAAVVLLSIGVAIAIGVSRQKAILAAQRAEASKLLAIAQLKLRDDPTEALAFALASLELADTREARLFSLRALQEAPPAWEVPSGTEIAFRVRFSPDGGQLAVAGAAEVGILSESGGPMVRLATEDMGRMYTTAGWPSISLLVTGPYLGRSVNVWSMPGGTKIRTIDFGAPSDWQVGPGRLFSKTPENAPSSRDEGSLRLRSWRLPQGEPEALGKIDRIGPGPLSSLFEPFGRAWFYTRGPTTNLVSLTPAAQAERLFSSHLANVSLSPTNRPDVLAQHDESGENRLVFFSETGTPVTKILPRPASAPPSVFATVSERWVLGDPNAEARLRVWDQEGLPGARPLELRRESSWYFANADLDPQAKVAVVSTSSMRRLTFWPLPRLRPTVVDGYRIDHRVLAFSPDGKWLATNWADNRIRLWPLPGNGAKDVQPLDPSATGPWRGIAFDPAGRYLFAVGIPDKAWILPLDGSPGRSLEKDATDVFLQAAAVSPSGRHVATAFLRGEKGQRTLRVWNVENGAVRRFELPLPEAPPGSRPTGHEGGILSLAFLDESTLLSSGHGGIRRWDLETGAQQLVRSAPYDHWVEMRLTSDQREVLFCDVERKSLRPASSGAFDLASGAIRGVAEFGGIPAIGLPAVRVVTQGVAFAVLGPNGSVGVARRPDGEARWLLGHSGAVQSIAISPDLRWIASAGEDNTLRLWPMPELSKPPLHTLPHEELLEKLKSLTNLRAVRDANTETGWKIELGPFPGWKNIPAYEPYPVTSDTEVKP